MFKIAECCFPFPKPVSLSGTSSVDYSPCWQWSFGHFTSWHTSMWFSFNSFSTSFTVALSGCWLRYATMKYAVSRLSSVVTFKIPWCKITKAMNNDKFSCFYRHRISLQLLHLQPISIYSPSLLESFSTNIYTLWLYIAFVSTKYWLT